MKYAKIGGQAVIEGIMMRCGDDYAVAVRTPDRHIEIKKEQYRGLSAVLRCAACPLSRRAGLCGFSYLGMKTLTYSAGFYEDEEEEAKKAVMEPRRSTPGFGGKRKLWRQSADGGHGCRVHCGCSRLIYDSAAVFHFQFIQPCDIIRIPAVTD